MYIIKINIMDVGWNSSLLLWEGHRKQMERWQMCVDGMRGIRESDEDSFHQQWGSGSKESINDIQTVSDSRAVPGEPLLPDWLREQNSWVKADQCDSPSSY